MSDTLEGITKEQFKEHRYIRNGETNPERFDNPVWKAMVRSYRDPYFVAKQFGFRRSYRSIRPMWSFQRYGYSSTVLPWDKGVVFVGGAHEMWGDPDFAIYNDVIVRRYDGTVDIYGYPLADFQPTDFHTATLVENSIYLVGNIGYPQDRVLGITPIYRLDLRSMKIQRIEVAGKGPSWISNHETLYWKDRHSLVIWGGQILSVDNKYQKNTQMWVFSLRSNRWRKIDAVTLKKSTTP